MGEQRMPNPDRAGDQPGKQSPDRSQQPNQRASMLHGEYEAARRQARQDPLQTRDR